MDHLKLHVLPRVEMTREEFLVNTLRNSIALDGVVKGGPFVDPVTKHMNIDHHDGVVREATMSTCKQVFYAIKAGLFESFRDERGRPFANAYLNDPDQDTSLSFFELQNYKMLGYSKTILILERVENLQLLMQARLELV